MPTLLLLCGLPGSGKTTLAKKLERERHALRLSPDEWLWSLSIDLYDEAKRTAVEILQWDLAARALALGVDVILENGFWSRAERDDYRSRAKALGAHVELFFLDVSRDELRTRLDKRNKDLPSAMAHIDAATLDLWWSRFEPPASDELEVSSD
jgi:predicted kinase